jgi:hypothetical protein
MYRRNILKTLATLPLFSFWNKNAQSALLVDPKENLELSPLAQEIESHFLNFQKQKCSNLHLTYNPYQIAGIWNDDMMHRARRLGCYWYWEDETGQEHGGSLDFLKKDLQSRFSIDKVAVAWEDAVNAVHNKYTGKNRTEYSQLSKYLDA